MALNTEIDALLAEADAQGVPVEQVVQQVMQRYQSEASADHFPTIPFEEFFPATPDAYLIWDYLEEYMADFSVTTPTDVAYARLWSAFVSRNQVNFLHCAFQLLRCFARDFQFNPTYPSYATMTTTLTGTATLNL